MKFLEETIDDISISGHTIEDIIFIGSIESGYCCNWEEFSKLADFEYDRGYGAAYAPKDLKIIFSDRQYMFRSEYDGCEWWDYCKPIIIPKKLKKIERLRLGFGYDLEEMHDPIIIEMED